MNDRWPFGRPGLLMIPIMLAAILLRVRELGALGFWIDEPLTWLAVNGILENGLPRLPSGMIYTRGPLYSYVVSLFGWVGGNGEFTLRLPSVLFSLALVFLVYRFGRELGGEAVGLVSALILAVSPWDVHYARMARMYAMFLFLFTLALYFIYLGYVKRQAGARTWAVIVAVLSVLTHRQGAALAVVFLLPMLFPKRSRPSLGPAIVGAAVVGLTLVAMQGFVDFGFTRGPTQVPTSADLRSLAVPLIGDIDINHARIILYDLAHDSPLVSAIGALLIAGTSVWLLVRSIRERKNAGTLIATWTFGLALCLNQLAIAAFCAFLILKLGEEDPRRAVRRSVLLLLVWLVAAGATIGAAVAAIGPAALADRGLLRALFAVPVPWYRLLITQFPFMALLVFGTVVMLLLRSLPEDSEQGGFLAAGCLVFPLFFMGFRPAPYFLHRYNVYLNPIFTILFTIGLLGLADWIRGLLSKRYSADGRNRPALLRITPAAVLILGLIACGQADPRQAWLLSECEYGDNRERIGDPDVVSHFYYDLKTTAEYVRARRGGDDLLIARDPVGLYPYLGLSDFVIRGPYYGQGRAADGRFVDVYLGVPHLDNATALDEVLQANGGRRVWVIMSDSVPGGPDVNVPPDVVGLLRQFDEHRVYTGLDRLTYVLRIDPAPPSGAVEENLALSGQTAAEEKSVKG